MQLIIGTGVPVFQLLFGIPIIIFMNKAACLFPEKWSFSAGMRYQPSRSGISCNAKVHQFSLCEALQFLTA
jgi:hypothetical protein